MLLQQGSTILLYTDGLVERRGTPLDEGLRVLAEAAAASEDDPEELVETVLGALIGEDERPDDVAVLAIRFAAPVVDDLRLVLPSTQNGLVEMREVLRAWLARGKVDEGVAAEAVLAVWEACANAIEHAQQPSQLSFRLRATLDDAGRMRIEVRDSGQWKPGNGVGRARPRSGPDAVVHGHGRGESGQRRHGGRDGTRRPRAGRGLAAKRSGYPVSMHRPYSASEAHRLLVESRPVEDGVAMVKLQGEADLHTAPILRDALNDAIESKPETLIVDLTGVTFIDSMMLGVLLSATRRARRTEPNCGSSSTIRMSDGFRAHAARPRDEALPECRDCARERGRTNLRRLR